MPTHYEILEVSKDATAYDIKEAYKRLALQYHPDKNHDADAPEHFKDVVAAFKILSNDEKRKLYDKNLVRTVQGMSFTTVGEKEEISHSSTALAINHTYHFVKTAEAAMLTEDELVDMAKKSVSVAMEILGSSVLFAKLNTNSLTRMAKNNKQVAQKIFKTYKFSEFTDYFLMSLAEDWEICESIFETKSLYNILNGYNLNVLINKHGKKALNKCLANPDLASIYNAYLDLKSYKKNSKKVVEDIDAFKKNIAISRINEYRLERIAKKNNFVAKALDITIPEKKSSSSVQPKNKNSKPVSPDDAYTYAKKSLKNCLEVFADEDLLKLACAFDGVELYDLSHKYGDKIKDCISQKPALQNKLESYLLLKEFKKDQCSSDKLYEVYGCSKITLSVLETLCNENEDLAIAVLKIADRIFSGILRIIDIAMKSEERANALVSNLQLYETLGNFGKLRLALEYKNPCLVYLKRFDVNQISGENLLMMANIHGNEVMDAILSNEVLRQRLYAYKLIKRVEKQKRIILEDKSSDDIQDLDNDELYYSMGLSYLNSDSKHRDEICASYFYKAALLGHELSFHELIKLAHKIDKDYYFKIAELYYDLTHTFSNQDKAVNWYQKSAKSGELKAVVKLCEILKMTIQNNRSDIILFTDPNYLIIADYLKNHTLESEQRNRLLRLMIECGDELGDSEISLSYYELLADITPHELFSYAHLKMDVIYKQQCDAIKNQSNTKTDEEIAEELNLPEYLSSRLNVSLIPLIKVVNLLQDDEMKSIIIIKLLTELASTHLVSKDIARLVLQDYQLSKMLPENALFDICKAQPEILRDKDSSYVAVNSIKNPDYLYALGWLCNTNTSQKLHVCSYLFWFKAAEQGHRLAVALVTYLSFPAPLQNDHPLIKLLEIKKYEQGALSLEDEDIGQCFTEEKYNEVISSLIFYLCEPKTFNINSTPLHCQAVIGNSDAFKNALDTHNQQLTQYDSTRRTPLNLLIDYQFKNIIFELTESSKNHPAKLERLLTALIYLMKDTNDFDAVTLIKEVCLHLEKNNSNISNHIIKAALLTCVQVNAVDMASLLLDRIAVEKQIEVIQSVRNQFSFSQQKSGLFVKHISSDMNNLFCKKISVATEKWNLFLDSFIHNIESYPEKSGCFTLAINNSSKNQLLTSLYLITKSLASHINQNSISHSVAKVLVNFVTTNKLNTHRINEFLKARISVNSSLAEIKNIIEDRVFEAKNRKNSIAHAL
ncbi:MAG: DnaJ domain-containing protein [Gammaproteobacteria bacterium]|nr:DnaJ domain-containing protein [Gammaproteobacteria bacterium]